MMKRLMALVLALCLAVPLAVCAAAEASGEASDITGKCSFTASEGELDRIFHSSIRRGWDYENLGAYVGGKLPDGAEAGWLRIEWFYEPTGFQVIEMDDGMNVLRTQDQTATFPNIYTVLPLLPQTRYFQVKMTAPGQKICNMKVYTAGTLPKDVQVWQPPVDKADLMVVSTHQDDELIFLGGTIPYYFVALKKPCVLVYMANCNRHRRYEALNALWKMGVKNYPDFVNLEDKKVGKFQQALDLWGGPDNILSLIVARIRRYKPEVIVTQDLDGEYGHNQHKVTARAMMYAIEAAADPERYPESAETYGTWQVKKLYHHLYKENAIQMDWETPMDELGGYTPLKVAQIGFEEHASQTKNYAVKSHGTYDNSKFGLYFTTVGADVKKDDFLENIDPDASATYVAEHAAEIAAYPIWPEGAAEAAPVEAEATDGNDTAEAEDMSEILSEEGADESFLAGSDAAETTSEAAVEPDPEASPEPGEAPQPTAPPQASRERSGGGAGLAVAMILAGVAAVGAGGWYAWRTLGPGRHRRRPRRK